MFVSPIPGMDNCNREIILLTTRESLFEELEKRIEHSFYPLDEVQIEEIPKLFLDKYMIKIYDDPQNMLSRKKVEPVIRNAFDVIVV